MALILDTFLTVHWWVSFYKIDVILKCAFSLSQIIVKYIREYDNLTESYYKPHFKLKSHCLIHLFLHPYCHAVVILVTWFCS